MKFGLVLCLLAVSCSVSFGQDEQCKNDFKTFITCAKGSKSDSDRATKKKEHQDKADKCFQQAGCDAPKWEDDPASGMKGMGGGMSMPESVKKCLKQKMLEKIGPKLNECLAKRGVRNVDWKSVSNDAEGTPGMGMDVTAGGGDGHGDLAAGMKAQFNTVKAVDKCCQSKKGGDTNAVKPLEQCLHDVKKDIKPAMCAAVKPCEAKISKPCKTRGQEIINALCQCKKEKMGEISGKLRVLGKEQKVGIQDLIKTVADDQDIKDMMGSVETCYQESNEPEPPMLKLAVAMMSGGGAKGSSGGRGGLGGMSVNGSTCIIMADMLTLDANDKSECENCP